MAMREPPFMYQRQQQAPAPEQQQAPAPAPQPEKDWMDGAVTTAAWVLLWYLFGPAPWRGYALRKRLAHKGNIWHAERRWNQHTSVALAWPLLYWAILAYFRVPVAQIWSAIFTTLAGWIHLPAIALLGSATLLPPTPGNLFFRWLIFAPLAPLIAHVLELLWPATPTTAKRVITPEDQQAHQAIAQAQKDERARLKALKAARAPRTGKKPPAAEPAGPHIPPATSLWGSVDWSKVRDDDPAKQLMLAELNKLSPTELANARRAQRMAQAQAQAVTSAPEPASSSSKPVSPPAAAPAQEQQDSDEYDWSAGDGSVSF
jgi:hypothetical protein